MPARWLTQRRAARRLPKPPTGLPRQRPTPTARYEPFTGTLSGTRVSVRSRLSLSHNGFGFERELVSRLVEFRAYLP